MRLRLKAYTPNGASLGVLPTPSSIQASIVLGDTGALSLDYAADAPLASRLDQPLELALEVSKDGATWAEPADCRFIYLRRSGDPVVRPGMKKAEAAGYSWRLGTAKVLPEGQLNADGKRAFLTKTVGQILVPLLTEAQNRGALTGLAYDFTTAADSSGAAWSQTVTLYYEPGMDYLTLIRNLFDQGLLDFRFSGRTLQVYNADTTMARHLDTADPVVDLRYGRDLTDAPFRGTWEGLANFAYVAGDNGFSLQRTNAAVSLPWGRQEVYLSQGGVSDTGTATVLADAALDQASAERLERTYGLSLGSARWLPTLDYGVGDYVAVGDRSDALNHLTAYRVRQVTLTRDAKGIVGGNAVLNDRFVEADIRTTRRVTGITGGSTASGGTGAQPAPPSPAKDTTVPKAPTGLLTSGVAYLDGQGVARSTITVDWDDVTQNTDNSAITDLASYTVYWRRHADTVWTEMGTTQDTTSSLTRGGFDAATQYDVVVRANDSNGHVSALSAVGGITTPADTTGPGTPSAPTVAAYLGTLRIRWDGLNDTGGAMAPDFARTEVHVSTVSGFAPDASTRVDTFTSATASQTTVPGLAYNVPQFVRLVAYDRSGNPSAASAQASATPVPLNGEADLQGGSVTYDAIAFKQPGNTIPDGTLESSAYRADLDASHALDAAWSLVNDAANAYSGAYALKCDATVGASTFRQAFFLGGAGIPIPGVALEDTYTPTGVRAQPSERWLIRARFKGTGLNGTTILGFRCYDRTGAQINTTFQTWTGATISGAAAWSTYSTVITAPAGTAYLAPLVEVRNDTTTGTLYVDDVEVRPVIGTLLVDDAAITSAKIQNLTADKITAGVMSAAITVSGRIATALTGQRTELNSTGLKAYAADGTTVTVDLNGTNNLVSGIFKTAASGARMELVNQSAGGAMFFYSGLSGETSPGYIWSNISGTGAGDDAWLEFQAPSKNSLPGGRIQLYSRDASSGADLRVQVYNGSVYWGGDAGYGSHYFGSNSDTTHHWLSLGPLAVSGVPDGVNMWSDGEMYFGSADQNGYIWLDKYRRINIKGNNSATSGQGGILISTTGGYGTRVVGYLDHSGGNLNMTNEFGETRLNSLTSAGLGYVQSMCVYNRTSSATAVHVNNGGTIFRLSSSERYKVNIDRDFQVPLDAVRQLRPTTFYNKSDSEEYAHWLDQYAEWQALPETVRAAQEPPMALDFPVRQIGLIAEDVQALKDLDELVYYGPDGAPEALHYDRLAVYLLPWLHELEAQVASLTERLAALESPAAPSA